MRMLFLAPVTVALCAASAASATIYTLTFDRNVACGSTICGDGLALSQSYGDVAGLDVSWRSMASVGNGSIFSNDMYFWDNLYGDLQDVAYSGGGVMDITFTVTGPGVTFTLLSFDNAGWPNADRDTEARLYQLDYTLIDSITYVAPGQGHYTQSCFNCSTTSGFVLQVGPDGFNGGIDNLTFEVTSRGAVPEPASWALMIAGFGMVGGTLRRRKAVAARG